LQVGGVQEPITVPAPPPAVALADPFVAVTEAGSDELQVKRTPVIVLPKVSTTVGVMNSELALALVTYSEIDSTAQVVKFTGMLVVFPTGAKMGVTPGTVAVTWTWPSCKTVGVVLKEATPRVTA